MTTPNEAIIVAAPTGATAPVAQDERPAYVPEKFWDAATKTVRTEEMAKSYAELEKQRGAKPAEAPPEEAVAEADKGEAGAFSAYFKEFEDTGAVSEDSLKKLSDLGISKQMVDAYVKGVTSTDTAAVNAAEAEVLAEVGGREKFEVVAEWAKTAADPAIVAAFNEASKTGKVVEAKLALAAIQAAYIKANGKAPSVRVNGTTSTISSDVYGSDAQFNSDIQNPLYKSDPAFREQVQAKLKRSNI